MTGFCGFDPWPSQTTFKMVLAALSFVLSIKKVELELINPVSV